MPSRLAFGHSPDPDDAFMCYALAHGKVDAEGLEFEFVRQDIQTLNERAARGELDVTALSSFAYAKLADRYRITASGSSVGDGYGPVIASNRVFIEAELGADTLIYVPGRETTAYLVLQLYAPQAKTELMAFDKILPAIVDGAIETGLLIHEGQITFANYGTYKIEDLGEWWQLQHGGLPLVLGVNAVKRTLPDDVANRVQRALKRSIEWGIENKGEALAYAKTFARGVDDWTVSKFVGMYVTPATLDLGDRGIAALRRLFERGAEIGLLPKDVPIDPVPGS